MNCRGRACAPSPTGNSRAVPAAAGKTARPAVSQAADAPGDFVGMIERQRSLQLAAASHSQIQVGSKQDYLDTRLARRSSALVEPRLTDLRGPFLSPSEVYSGRAACPLLHGVTLRPSS